MRPKTSRSDAGGGCSSSRGGGGGGSCGAGCAPVESVGTEVPAGIGPGPPSPPAAGGGENGSASPPPDRGGPSSTEPPRSARRSGARRFGGLGPSGPNAEERRVPSVPDGAAHRRVAGGPESGRAWEAGWARPSQGDSAAAPARRTSGMSTWSPSTTRGGALGQRGPAAGSLCPSWPARQQRLMPQPRLLHPAHDGAPCSKQSAPCVPLPAPGGWLRCGAASRTLLSGARGGLLAYGSRGRGASRGRGK